MRSVLGWFGRHAGAAMGAGVFIGLLVPPLATAARPLLPVAVVGLLVLASARIDPAALRVEASRPLRLVLTCAALLVVAPVLVWLAGQALALPPVLAAAMVLGASLPTLFAAPAIALVLGLDAVLMLSVVIVTALAAPFALALVAGPVLSLELTVSPFAMMLRLAALILGCFAAGLALRRVAGARRIEALRAPLDGIAVILLLLFAVAIMHGVPAAFAADPARVALWVAAAFGLNLGLQAAAAVGALALGLERRRALTLGFAGGNRNLGLLLAVLPASADPGLALFLAMGQFPIYLLPGLLAPVYRWALRA